MYRSRFNADLNKYSLDYTSSTTDDAAIILYDIIGSQAHVLMLYKNNIIPKNDSIKILIALEELKKLKIKNNLKYDDVHELIESMIINKLGIKCGGKMHTGRSRNDQISLDLRLKLREDVNMLCFYLIDLIDVLILLANKNKRTIMPLYTHLQQAQIGLFSHYLLSYADSLLRDFDRLYASYDRINECPLGSGPIGGTSMPIDRKFIMKKLKFKKLISNSIDATSTRDFVVEYLSLTSILMTNISRMAEDFIIWSTSEFSFIELADEFTSTSSIMPQKKNCDVLEIARGKTSCVIGNNICVLTILKSLPSGYNRDLQEIKKPLWSSSEISIQTIFIFKMILKSLIIKKSRMRNISSEGYLISLDIAEALVKKKIAFRTAHKIVGKLVQIAYELNKPLSKLTVNEIKNSVEHDNHCTPELLIKIINSVTLESSLSNRMSYGSSGFYEQEKMLDERLKKIKSYKLKINKRRNEIKNAITNFSAEIKKTINRV